MSQSPAIALKKLHVKKQIVGRSQYNKVSPIYGGKSPYSFGTELFSKKKQKFPVRRLYISDVPMMVDNEEIMTSLCEYGEVSYVEDSDSNDGQSEARAVFVTFSNSEDAVRVISDYVGRVTLGGKLVNICEAVPKKSQIFVGGLQPETDEEDLISFFSKFGHVCESVLKTDNRTGLSRCFGFITFVDSDRVVKDLLRNRFIEMYGKRIEVKPAVPMNQQTRMKRAEIAAAITVANDQANNIHKLTGNVRKGMETPMIPSITPMPRQAHAPQAVPVHPYAHTAPRFTSMAYAPAHATHAPPQHVPPHAATPTSAVYQQEVPVQYRHPSVYQRGYPRFTY
jgi:RNA recognition motif-containing protein